jgi:glyoxalase family protein
MTMVAKNARENARFYRDLLGLRLVKKTINFDMPDTYHLYYGDNEGSPGTLLTFFEWPDAPAGHHGWGGTHHLALQVANGAALAYWRGHLEREDVDVSDPFDDHGYPTIRFSDPDGLLLELSAPKREEVPEGSPALYMPSMAIGPLHHVSLFATNRDTALAYYRDLLGFEIEGEGTNPDNPVWTDIIFRTSDAEPDVRLIVTIVDRNAMDRAVDGPGQTHHIAFGVPDDAQELAWLERIGGIGVPISEVRDRQYFHSIYFRDPDGHLLEIATANPGFAVDEPLESLGQALKLPEWYEERRAEIEKRLVPLD